MRIERITEIDENLIKQIMSVWEASIRQTHIFLTDADIAVYKERIEKAIPDLEQLFCAYDDDDLLIAFLGINGERIEMIFVEPESRGKGIGRSLLEMAIEVFGVKLVDVNEQSQQAVGFFEYMNFRTVDRVSRDFNDNPYPILTMQYFPVRNNAFVTSGSAKTKKVVPAPVVPDETAAAAGEKSEGSSDSKKPKSKKKISLLFIVINTLLFLIVVFLVFLFIFPEQAQQYLQPLLGNI